MHQAEGVTGILLIYPGYAVHCVESSSDVIYEILRDLCAKSSEASKLLLEPKILNISHDLPTRFEIFGKCLNYFFKKLLW